MDEGSRAEQTANPISIAVNPKLVNLIRIGFLRTAPKCRLSVDRTWVNPNPNPVSVDSRSKLLIDNLDLTI